MKYILIFILAFAFSSAKGQIHYYITSPDDTTGRQAKIDSLVRVDKQLFPGGTVIYTDSIPYYDYEKSYNVGDSVMYHGLREAIGKEFYDPSFGGGQCITLCSGGEITSSLLGHVSAWHEPTDSIPSVKTDSSDNYLQPSMFSVDSVTKMITRTKLRKKKLHGEMVISIYGTVGGLATFVPDSVIKDTTFMTRPFISWMDTTMDSVEILNLAYLKKIDSLKLLLVNGKGKDDYSLKEFLWAVAFVLIFVFLFLLAKLIFDIFG